MDFLEEYGIFLIPAIIVQLVLMVTAAIHVVKHPHYKFGNKPMWLAIVILIQIIGPICYFVFGRKED